MGLETGDSYGARSRGWDRNGDRGRVDNCYATFGIEERLQAAAQEGQEGFIT